MSYVRFQSALFKRFSLLLLIPVLGFQGCNDKPITPITEKSVVFTDIKALAGPFSFKKTMDQIVATSYGAPTSSVLMLKSMIDSFAANSFVHPKSGKTIDVASRPLESGINPSDLLNPDSSDGMIPVGLFNRFDLAPVDGSNCGEYRIVYAKRKGGDTDRMTMIFEAKVPNPDPSKGLAGCAPITDFWAQRSNDSDSIQTVTELEKLYYQGIPGVEPVVKAKNYGLPLGQLRVNLFKTPNFQKVKWALREFLVGFNQNGQAIFKPEPVDDSPIAALFREAAPLLAGFNATDLNDFRNGFLGQPLCNLVNPDRISKNASARDIINGISAGYDPRFNDFESISQGDEDSPAAKTDPQLLDQVQARLAALTDLSGVSREQLMNRAGTMTCGGCHDFSAGKDLGNGAIWPGKPRSFVHIDENGELSPLLKDFFIPRRVQIAQRFKENRKPFQQTAATCSGVASTSKSTVIQNVNKAREHNLYKDVDTVRDQIQQIVQEPETAEKSEKLKAILPVFKEVVDLARQLESTSGGAYTPARTH